MASVNLTKRPKLPLSPFQDHNYYHPLQASSSTIITMGVTVGRVFGMIATNIFFLGVVAMLIAIFTMQVSVMSTHTHHC